MKIFQGCFPPEQSLNDGSAYYGPYTSAYAVKVLLGLVRQLYPLRTCKHALTDENIKQKKFKVCLEYHIGNCRGACENLQSLRNMTKAFLKSSKSSKEI